MNTTGAYSFFFKSLKFLFLKSWLKDRLISTIRPGPFSMISKILKILKISKKLKTNRKIDFKYFKNFTRVVFYPVSKKWLVFIFDKYLWKKNLK